MEPRKQCNLMMVHECMALGELVAGCIQNKVMRVENNCIKMHECNRYDKYIYIFPMWMCVHFSEV